ncbi:MAG TPA: type IV pilus assembly protein PilM [Fimbriimonadaceae bacterium]|nr:type IV pilus assembly protein PilM [Fimbriimonadaceae bacterium]
MGFFTKKNFIGIDIGHHSIKAVALERHGDGWRVVRFASTPTPIDAVKDGVVVDLPSTVQALKSLLKEHNIGAGGAMIAVSGGSVVVRQVRMPKMAEATLRKSIKFEASRYVPSSVEDSYIEFEIIGPVDDQQMDVLMVAAPKDVVESRLQACEEAGLEVESVDIEAFAMYRALVEADMDQEWSDKTIALVDVGSATTNVSVVSHGVFAMTRSIPQGSDTLTQALKSYFKLSDEDAESGKAQLDLRELLDESKPKENPPLRVLQPHVDDLVREIRRSLNYYQSQQQEGTAKQIDHILLTGGGAKLAGLCDYFNHKLSIETTLNDVFNNPRFSHYGDAEESGLDLSVASGLAMRAYAKAA